VNAELALFDPGLGGKPQVVGINKIDLPQVADRLSQVQADFRRLGYQALGVSALARTGLRPLLYAAHQSMTTVEPEVPHEQIPVYRSEPDPTAFEVSRDPDGGWRLSGKAIERAAEMTYWEYDEAVRRFQRLLVRLGAEEALRQAGVQMGDTVRIGEYELEWQD
jgi:GTP-binding protein